VPDSDDTLRRIDDALIEWHGSFDSMTWSPPPGGVDFSGLPATAEPDTDPGPTAAIRRRPDRSECDCGRRHCDGSNQCQTPAVVLQGLGYFVPDGHRAYGWASVYIDPSAPAEESVEWARQILADRLRRSMQWQMIPGLEIGYVIEAAGRPENRGTLVTAIAHRPMGPDAPALSPGGLRPAELTGHHHIRWGVIEPTPDETDLAVQGWRDIGRVHPDHGDTSPALWIRPTHDRHRREGDEC
jgi:hypothetical protein